ncbi:MAG: response regulator transcription factor [Anaerolinea sp.]|nr:response regulator transcription factor [Anaerolinea sp.]
MIRVLHADDHAIVREGVRALLLTEPNIELVASAVDGNEAIQLALTLQPDVIVMDLQMPRKGGIEAIQDIKAALPEARILVVTSFAEDEKVFPAIKAGALGYLLKDSAPQDLLQAIHDVYAGRLSLHPAIASKVVQELQRPANQPAAAEPLTTRELEILRLVAQGLTNQDIAEKLTVSERTVRTHVSNILSKLHLANRTQAALYALREGIAPLE